MRVLYRNRISCLGAILGIILITGCSSLGPERVRPAPFEYNEVVAQSWNEQLLLNLVRLHYRDTPAFLEVDQIIAGYTFERETEIGVRWIPGVGPLLDQGESRFQAGYVERPTVTLTPLKGEAFNLKLLTPYEPKTLMLLTESGWQVERVFLCCLASVNGLRNLPSTLDANQVAPRSFGEFRRLAASLERVQRSPGGGIRLQANDDGKVYLALDGEGSGEAWRLLGLEPDRGLAELVAEHRATDVDGVSFVSRSLLGTLHFLSRYVAGPPEDYRRGLADDTAEATRLNVGRLFRVTSSRSRPENAFVTIKYRNHWFYIPDDDLDAKETFGLVTQLFSLQTTRDERLGPLVTVPAN